MREAGSSDAAIVMFGDGRDWHGRTLTPRVEGLMELAPRLEIAINPSDARRLGVDDGGRLRVGSRRGELTGYARVSEAV